ERDQDYSKDQRHIGQYLRPPIRTRGLVRPQRGGEPLDSDATDDRANQRAPSAHDDPNDDLRGLGQAKNRRAYEISPIGEKTPGKAGERAADGEGRKLVGPGIVAQQFSTPFVFP